MGKKTNSISIAVAIIVGFLLLNAVIVAVGFKTGFYHRWAEVHFFGEIVINARKRLSQCTYPKRR